MDKSSYRLFLLQCEQNRRKNKNDKKAIQKLTDEELELLIEKEEKNG